MEIKMNSSKNTESKKEKKEKMEIQELVKKIETIGTNQEFKKEVEELIKLMSEAKQDIVRQKPSVSFDKIINHLTFRNISSNRQIIN